MKVGNVIKNKHGLWVVTHVDSSGDLLDCKHIDDFICDNAVVVDTNRERRTIREIIEERKRLYLIENKIIIE